MPDATVTAATIRPQEAAHFAKLANDWWDPKGSSAMLHRMNPVRLQFREGKYLKFYVFQHVGEATGW